MGTRRTALVLHIFLRDDIEVRSALLNSTFENNSFVLNIGVNTHNFVI